MGARFVHPMPFGATLRPDGTARFRVWAPSVVGMSVQIDGGLSMPMREEAGGWHVAEIACTPGTRYKYRVPDGMLVPDPASRLQHGDVHGWSVVFDPAAHEWHFDDWQGRPWHEAVIYELHVGLLGGFQRRRRAAGGVARPRRDRDRVDADRRFPRRAQLGL